MRVLLIDDLRTIGYISSTYGIDVTDIAITGDLGIERLKEGNWDLVLLDHDLGSATDKTGYDVMCFLEENSQYLPKEIFLVTANPVGRHNMQVVIDRLYPKK